MDEKQETTDDIIAEMRDRKEMLVNAISSAPLCYPVDNMKAKVEILDEFIDRLEAAHNREVKVITAKLEEARHCWKVWSDRADELKNKCNEQYINLKTAGNGAKMREVVELLARVILPPQEEYPAEYGGGKVPDKDGWLAWIRQVQSYAKSALAEPRRNCDKYMSLDEARNAYMAINEMPEGNHDEDMRRWLCNFHSWLFAEAKGDAK